MSKEKFELDSDGVRALLKSEEMMNSCKYYAEQVSARCGFGFGTHRYVGKNRVNVSVFPKTRLAAARNYKENILLKALK